MRRRSRKLDIALILLVAATGWPSASRADGTVESDEFGIYFGNFLPNQIEGVTEMLPVFGLRYAYPIAPAFAIEGGLANSHAKGIDFTALTVDFRADVELAAQVMALAYGGLTFDYYIPNGRTDRTSGWGGNVGGGVEMGVTDNLWLRGDMAFSANPGTALFFGLGLALRTN